MPKPPTRSIANGTGHRYELDGEKVPGVTTIIKAAIPMPALVGWAAKTVSEYVFDRLVLVPAAGGEKVASADELIADLRAFNETRKYPERLGGGLPRVGLAKVLAQVQYASRDEAAVRGTEVHSLAERIARGEEVEVPEHLEGHVDAYVAFLEDWRPTDAIIERVVVNRRSRYMGRLDLIATLPHVDVPGFGPWGGRTLLDVKTSRSGPYGDTALQLSAYGGAETMLTDELDESGAYVEVPMEPVESYGVIWVRADGYDLIPFHAGPKTFRVFLHARQVAHYLDEKTGAVNDAKGPAATAPELEESTAP